MRSPSADSIDLVSAFVRWHGLRLLEDRTALHHALNDSDEDVNAGRLVDAEVASAPRRIP